METEIVSKNVITEICGKRDESIRLTQAAIDAAVFAMDAYTKAVEYSNNISSRIPTKTEGFGFLVDSGDASNLLKSRIRDIDTSIWMSLLYRTGMDRMMDAQAKSEFAEQVHRDPPAVNEDNIHATLSSLRADSAEIFRRGLANVFSKLDTRFRSHDAFKFKHRIIFKDVCDDRGHLNWMYDSSIWATVADVERILAILDRKEPDPIGLLNLVRDDRQNIWGAHASSVTSRYFKINIFKNGNAHLWFTRKDLVQKANLELAAYYGEVLPDAYDEHYDMSTSTALSKDLAFYETPESVIDSIFNLIERNTWHMNNDNKKNALEPSAGAGAIVRRLLDNGMNVTAIEAHEGRVAKLRHTRATVHHSNFLKVKPVRRYDIIAMNPPFCGTHWMSHVVHAEKFLSKDGFLVSVVPVSVVNGETKKHKEFRKWLSDQGGEVYHLPIRSFSTSGTNISTCLIYFRRK